MDLKLLVTYKSLPAGLEWNDIPNFTIITGKNGTGKSHLLEAMNQINNWEGQDFLQKEIKYISPKHNFIQVDDAISCQYIEEHNKTYYKILDIAKIIQKPDIKGTIKQFNMDLLNMAKQNINVFENEYNRKIISSKGHNIYKEFISIVNSLIQNKQALDYILQKTEHKKFEDITEEEILDNLYTDTNNNFRNTSDLKIWFFLYLESFSKKISETKNKNAETRMKMQQEKHPWELMNEILNKYGFKYQIVDFDSDTAPIKIEFTDGIVNTLLNSTQEPHQKKKNLVVYF